MKQEQDKLQPDPWRVRKELADAMSKHIEPIFVPPPPVDGIIDLKPQTNEGKDGMGMIGITGQAIFPPAWNNQTSAVTDSNSSTPITKDGSVQKTTK